MTEAKSKRGYRTLKVNLSKSELVVYVSPRLANALDQLVKDMTLYQGVKFAQILEAIYQQGKKDGAANAFGEIEKGVREAQRLVPHRRPGRPKKRG